MTSVAEPAATFWRQTRGGVLVVATAGADAGFVVLLVAIEDAVR